MSPRRRDREPGPTAAERLVGRLRAQVLDGRLAPGAPLREAALAQEWGVSRHTVRSVLARLASERLVVVEPYRGARVADLDAAALEDLQRLRAALECEAVRLLRTRHGPDWPAEVVRPVRAAVADLATAEAADPQDWPAVARAHSRVHQGLVDAAGSARISAAYAGLDAEILLLLLHVRPHYGPGELAAEHEAYLADVMARGEDAVRDHLAHSTVVIRDSLSP